MPPNLDLIQTVREFIEALCNRLLQDTEVSSKVAVAAHELIENAVKFSLDGVPELKVELDAERGLVSIATVNRADPRHLEALREVLREISEVENTGEYYRTLMVRSAEREDGSSGLGLGRILAESNMTISGSIDLDRVIICARISQHGVPQ